MVTSLPSQGHLCAPSLWPVESCGLYLHPGFMCTAESLRDLRRRWDNLVLNTREGSAWHLSFSVPRRHRGPCTLCPTAAKAPPFLPLMNCCSPHLFIVVRHAQQAWLRETSPAAGCAGHGHLPRTCSLPQQRFIPTGSCLPTPSHSLPAKSLQVPPCFCLYLYVRGLNVLRCVVFHLKFWGQILAVSLTAISVFTQDL